MTPIAAVTASTSLLLQLANFAARSLALAVAAGLGLAAFRVRSTSIRLFTWKSVLYAALAMPLLGWMLPPLTIPTPALLRHARGWRSASSAAIKPFFSARASASEADEPSLAAERRQIGADGAIRGKNAALHQPQRGERPDRKQTLKPLAADTPWSANTATPPTAPPLTAASASSFLSSIPWSSIPWATVAAGLYLAISSLLLVRFFIGFAFTRRLLGYSQTIDDPRLTQKLASRAYTSGMTFIPHAAESEFISVPVTMGALHSTILLPTAWREWDDAKLNAVLAHEVSHVARRDALTQRLSLLHRAIFWFSPLAWWLNRRLAELAEQASDEAALSGGADRADYARILLGFFEALQTAPGRVWWQGVSMAKAGQAEERLERILSWKGSVAMHLKKSIAVTLVALSVLVIYLTASARPADFNVSSLRVALSQDKTVPPAPSPGAEPKTAPEPAPASEMIPPPAEPAPSAEFAPVAPVRTITGVPSSAAPLAGPIYPPKAAMAPVAAVPPALWRTQSSGSGSSGSGPSHSTGRSYSYHYGYDDDQRFVIVSGKTDSLTMSGSMDDAHHVEKLRKQIQGDFIWFQRDEKSYIIRDQATIDRARKFWEPQEELGKKQEALGKQQEALGKQQEELGKKMEQVQVNVPDMTAELDKLKAKLQKLGSHATMEQIGDLQSEIGELQSKIGEIQSQAGEQQGKLGEQQGALGEKQGKLGEQQGELGRQQGELARQANVQMKQLLDDSIKNGVAQPEP
jgi:beta-lactamase regulating signal transducer with metallopeptidase domain